MKKLGTSPGIGIGKVFLYKTNKVEIYKENIEDFNLEIDKFVRSLQKAKDEIDKLYNTTKKEIGTKEAEIFMAHRMILEDPEFIMEVKKQIKNNKINAEWAVKETANKFINLFKDIEVEYLQARTSDIKDVRDRILRILLNGENIDLLSMNEDSIIIAEDLTPSDTAAMNKNKVVGFVTELGGRTSHTSIIARSLEIPAIAGKKDITKMVEHGDYIVIDGNNGHVLVNPTKEELIFYKNKLEEENNLKNKLKKMIDKKTISKDNYKVELLGNVSISSDVDNILDKDGEGVGLLRSEFLYMNRVNNPTEEEQFEVYKKIAIKLKNKTLTIRTLDVGGDKLIPHLNLPKEINPYLGYRAIRVGLDKPDILKTQLKAIYRASYYGNINILFPMISSVEELRKTKEITKEVKKELKRKNIPFSEKVKLGIMVEVPAVAVHARAFAKEIDFFSIGTNDLIQYTIAVDRGNQKIANLYNQYHPAVLRLIKMTIDAAHIEGIKVGMCGEVAGDEKLIPLLLGMGLDEFSMNSGSILKARYQIRNTSKKEMETHIDTIINLATAKEVEKYIDKIN
ncbi:MAG: phosphoenolpyruvate--protein phosphotransferase [Tissierella sp.]|uniref:phosphoenolpyruvate--protein phosphotransferase n=1 Tax=Tissierella sp. TaxID=41274 RepID=UPI003F9CF1F4